jgi:quinol-cytochrome oxidoreductase complex cytochrome b subunit
VRGGLFVRQVHHWAALMFTAAIMVHLARVFFTGAFRGPREANWLTGSALLILAMFEGYFGYSLPDDLLSGIGLRAALSSITLGMPMIGTWLHWALFGGDFPGHTIIPRNVCPSHPAPPRADPGVGGRPPGAVVVRQAHPISWAGTNRKQRHQCSR